jgi:transketolase
VVQAGATTTPVVTVVGLGPMVLNALGASVPAGAADFFVVSQVPVGPLPQSFLESVRRTGRLVVVEEHVERGGIAEHLALALMREKLSPAIETRCALGYPSKTYGSQRFHQTESGLDPASVAALVERCANR